MSLCKLSLFVCLVLSLVCDSSGFSENINNEEQAHYSEQYLESRLEKNISSLRDVSSDVKFILYNGDYPQGIEITVNDSFLELQSMFIDELTTKIITHGWLADENTPSVDHTRLAYLKAGDFNVVTVGWSNISRNEYIKVTTYVKSVGISVGKMLTRVLDAGVTKLEKLHLVGHSLGSHVMGVAGGFLRDNGYGKVGRITGLDPAGPVYERIRNENLRLDFSDGQFVDVIHSCIGVYGYVEPIGHADFYPNGGFCNQPGCTFAFDMFCGHRRAFQYFQQSINKSNTFIAVKCRSYFGYLLNLCRTHEFTYMGEQTPTSSRGIFYLNTNDQDESIPSGNVSEQIEKKKYYRL